MGIQIQGNGGVIADVDGTGFRALRVTTRPTEYGALGAYAVTATTGIYSGLAAASPLFSMRWGDATRLCIVQRFSISVRTTTAASTAGVTSRGGIIARAFTASDSAGTAIVLTGNNQKKRTSMGSSLMTDMRVAAAAALTAGTRTLDALPFGVALGWSSTAAASTQNVGLGQNNGIRTTDLLQDNGGQEHPIILAQNEGIIGRVEDVMPTGSSQQTTWSVVWTEAAAY